VYRALLTAAWVISLIYATIPCFWFLAHPFAARWRSRSRSPYRVLLPAWAAIIFLAGVITSPWRHVLLYSATWTWAPALLLFATGLYLYRRAREGFTADQLAGRPELERDRGQALATAGIRARMRHPIYAGHLCELLGWSVGTGLVVIYALTVFAILTGALMISMEERELEARFGSAYRDYRQRVPAILPRIPRSN
jgi:protein-S-isoprenylcysteine O-methyltransferase Ste14